MWFCRPDDMPWDGGEIPSSEPHSAVLLIQCVSFDCYLLEGSLIRNRAGGIVDIHGV